VPPVDQTTESKHVDKNDRATACGDTEQHKRQVGISSEVVQAIGRTRCRGHHQRVRLVNAWIEVPYAQGEVHGVKIAELAARRRSARATAIRKLLRQHWDEEACAALQQLRRRLFELLKTNAPVPIQGYHSSIDAKVTCSISLVNTYRKSKHLSCSPAHVSFVPLEGLPVSLFSTVWL
jgi:hypothetical protein